MSVPQEEIARFWEYAREIPFGRPTGGLLHRQLMAATNYLDDRELTRRLRFIGSAERRQIEDLFQPNSHAPQERLNHNGRRSLRRGSGAGKSRIFHHPWHPVTVVPFEESPGKICAFAFLDAQEGYESYDPFLHPQLPLDFSSLIKSASANNSFGSWAGDDAIIFKAVDRVQGQPAEAGLAMLSVAGHSPPPELSGMLFVVLDLVMGLHIQLQWMQTQMCPLPLVVARDDERSRTFAPWQGLARDQKIIFLAQAAEPRLFRQARLAGGKVFIDPKIIGKANQSIYGQASLFKAQRNAKPWQHVLRNELRKRSSDEAAAMLEQVQLSPSELADFLKECDVALINHVSKSSDSLRLGPRSCIGSEVVYEDKGAWFIEQTGERICDAVRVEQILCRQDGTRLLRGSLLISGEQQEFTISEAQVDKLGLPRCLEQYFYRHRLQFRCLHGWPKKLLSVALEMKPVETVVAADVVGWQDGKFRFPNFGIDYHGLNSELNTPLIDEKTPAKNLLLPPALERQKLRPITLDSPEVNRFWAVLIRLASCALAPALNMPPQGTVLAGSDNQRLARTISNTFGCLEFKAPKRVHARQAYEDLNAKLASARWPIILQPAVKTNAAMQQMFASLKPNHCFVPVADILFANDARTQGWFVILADDAQPTLQLLEDFGPAILLNYLRDAMMRRLWIPSVPGKPFERISLDIAKWMGDLAGGRPAVEGAERVLWLPAQSGGGLTENWRTSGGIDLPNPNAEGSELGAEADLEEQVSEQDLNVNPVEVVDTRPS